VLYDGCERSEAIETLRRSEPALRQRGVKHAALFGSVARGDDRPDSDIDIMIEVDPDARITVLRLSRFEGVHCRAVRRARRCR
jgi:predicted nucleotidyltransferase